MNILDFSEQNIFYRGGSARYYFSDHLMTVARRHYGVRHAELASRKKKDEIVTPRQTIQYLLHNLAGESKAHVGQRFSYDESTAFHSIKRMHALLARGADSDKALYVKDKVLNILIEMLSCEGNPGLLLGKNLAAMDIAGCIEPIRELVKHGVLWDVSDRTRGTYKDNRLRGVKDALDALGITVPLKEADVREDEKCAFMPFDRDVVLKEYEYTIGQIQQAFDQFVKTIPAENFERSFGGDVSFIRKIVTAHIAATVAEIPDAFVAQKLFADESGMIVEGLNVRFGDSMLSDRPHFTNCFADVTERFQEIATRAPFDKVLLNKDESASQAPDSNGNGEHKNGNTHTSTAASSSLKAAAIEVVKYEKIAPVDSSTLIKDFPRAQTDLGMLLELYKNATFGDLHRMTETVAISPRTLWSFLSDPQKNPIRGANGVLMPNAILLARALGFDRACDAYDSPAAAPVVAHGLAVPQLG